MNLFSGLKATFLGQPDFPWDNRRRHPRVRLRIPISHGELLDLSAEGLRIDSSQPAHPGDTLSIWPEVALIGRQRLKCRVAWCRALSGRYQLGLGWSDPDSWLDDLWKRVQPSWTQRRHLRVLCQLDVQLTTQDEPQSWHGLCHDLSPGGCRIQVQAHLALGQTVRLDFAALSLTGTILHREGTTYHLRFGSQPCPRLRGLLLNLLQAHAPLMEDPLLDEEILPLPAPLPQTTPQSPRQLSSVPVPKLPEPSQKSGLPEHLPPLQKRSLLPDRNPSLWAARLLPLRKGLGGF